MFILLSQTIERAAFDNALKVWGVSTNFTMGLSWIRPDTFLNLDQTNRNYLDIKLPSKGLSADFYIKNVKEVMGRGESLTDISAQRGYRPLADQAGTFGLQDSNFYNFCKVAENDSRDYVFIIDEINRGNLSQIFGELLMLMEADKRGPEFAVPLVYQRPGEPRFFVPKMVFIVGLMNLADRSLANWP